VIKYSDKRVYELRISSRMKEFKNGGEKSKSEMHVRRMKGLVFGSKPLR